VPADYEKIRGTDIERIFEEVTLADDLFQSVTKSLEVRP
jgi:hypothetical protein